MSYLKGGFHHPASGDISSLYPGEQRVHAIRLFKYLPKWDAYYRDEHGDSLPEREEYLKQVGLAKDS